MTTGSEQTPGWIFMAYSSNKEIADRMTHLASELREAGHQVTTWDDIKDQGFIFGPIQQCIDAADLTLAEITSANPNVLFELGYATGAARPSYPLFDESAGNALELKPLSIVRQIRYTSRKDVVQFLHEADRSVPVLADQMGLALEDGESGRLYFIPSQAGVDLNEAIWTLCADSPFEAKMIDSLDTEYDSLTSQAKSIARSDLVVTLLVNEDKKDYRSANAKAMLYAGLAHGLGKEIVVLVQDPLPQLLDLGDRAIRFESESDCALRFKGWLTRTASVRLKSAAPRRSVVRRPDTQFAQLFLGSLNARADFNLASYFLTTPEYHHAEAGKKYLFVGSRGSGKTANFEMLRDQFDGRNVALISIAPASFELPRLAGILDAQLPLAHWEFVYGSFWRFILITEILRVIRSDFLDHLLVQQDRRHAQELLSWMREREAQLSKDFGSRVEEVLSDVGRVTGDEQTRRDELARILHTVRLYDIEDQLQQFSHDIEIRLFIDDLDINWDPLNESANRLVLALLNEIQRLMASLSNLKPAVFIRRDLFDWLEHNDSETLKRDPAFLEWDKESLENLVALRIRDGMGSSEADPSALWRLVFPRLTRGEPTQDFIISRTLMRPRDVIQFCQKSVESAQRAGREAVSEDDVFNSWDMCGELILAQAESDNRSGFQRFGDLTLAFMETPASQSWRDASALLAHKMSDPKEGLRLLYEINFLGIRTPGGNLWFSRDRAFAHVQAALGDDFEVSVHPAFRQYLRCVG